MIRLRIFSFSRIFLLWIRSISIVTLFFQVQTLISISRYAIELHQQRKILIEQLQTLGCLFHSTIRQCENQAKSTEKNRQKTLKKLKKMYDEKWPKDHRIRTI